MKAKTSTMFENSSSPVPGLIPDTHEEDELEKILEEWKRNAFERLKRCNKSSGASELMTLSLARFFGICWSYCPSDVKRFFNAHFKEKKVERREKEQRKGIEEDILQRKYANPNGADSSDKGEGPLSLEDRELRQGMQASFHEANMCKERVRELRGGAGPSRTSSQERRDLEVASYSHEDIDAFQGYRRS
ncbi:hypothetical protein H6P81_003310 [Aristolochia fimbriata]|uniref:Uncharacterized protein n=1 Tax=Aristolochia fimbriata TaxID=158543 RepID=A0AAV7FFI3_ARIFI|nr:hypothetical protein H6P81_003310 [Aristolochia fimbriata]